MSAITVHPVTGATAAAEGRHPRHLLGNALRAVRVVAETTFEVVVLGRVEERDELGVRTRRG